jgi:hypothetical protein
MEMHGHVNARSCPDRKNVTPDQRQERIAIVNVPSKPERIVPDGTNECGADSPPTSPEVFPPSRVFTNKRSNPLGDNLRLVGGINMKPIERHGILQL